MSGADILTILQGAVTTVSLSCVGILLGLPLGLLLAITRWARVPVVAQVVTVYVSILRATPLVTLLLLIFFALPNTDFTSGTIRKIVCSMPARSVIVLMLHPRQAP